MGVIKEDTATIDAPIGRDNTDRKKMAVTSINSKDAVTHLKVLKRFKDATLIELQLETGRTHQIRVHAKHLGHPIVGDKTYGIKNQKFNLDGQLLHAYKLELTHPSTNERKCFECELPNYFKNLLNKLK